MVMQFEILLVIFWLLAVLVRRLCDKILDTTYYWLLSSVRGRYEFGTGVTEASMDKGGLPAESKKEAAESSSGVDDDSQNDLWQQYFANPEQWWDNRGSKRNPRSPDFNPLD
jgi:hypothetical protein